MYVCMYVCIIIQGVFSMYVCMYVYVCIYVCITIQGVFSMYVCVCNTMYIVSYQRVASSLACFLVGGGPKCCWR